MEIEPLVTPLVVRAEGSESLAAAARRLWAHEIGALPVFDGDTLVGILSERDLVTATALGASSGAAVAAHMTPLPATAGPAESSAVVARRMLDLGVRHLPVVDGGRVVGMISATDLLTLVAWPERPAAESLQASA
jgi:CBS domain-containing protein